MKRIGLGLCHTTHQIVRLSMVPNSFTVVNYLAVAERRRVKKVVQRIGALNI